MDHNLKHSGFDPAGRPRHTAQRTALALIATIALAISTLLVATVVSMGIARAELAAGHETDDSRLAVALLLGVVLAGMAGLTAVTAIYHKSRPRKA